MKILFATLAVFSVAVVSPAASFADDTAAWQEESDPTADSSVSTPVDEGLSDGPSGNTMAEFVAEAQTGWKRHFSDDDTLTLMRASRALKGSDKDLARKVEKIATKIANL